MTTIFPLSASAGQSFSPYIFDGSSWNIDNSIFAEYLDESTASATYLNKVSASNTYLTQTSASSTYQTSLSVGTGLTLNSSTVSVNPGAMLNAIVDGTSGNSYGIVGTSTYLDVKNTNGYNKEIELDIAAVESQLVTDGFLKNSSASGIYLTQVSASSIYATKTELNNIDLSSASAAAVAAIVDSAPSTLNTLNELAAALGDDANYASTITTALGNKLDISTASSTYLTQSSASTTYLAQASASSTYLTQTSASNTYLTQTSASTTYATKAEVIEISDITPLDNIKSRFDGAQTRFLPTYLGNTIAITNPYRLFLNINGIIQMVEYPELIWGSPLPRQGFWIDDDGYIVFSEAPPPGSTFDARMMAGSTTTTKTKLLYPFEAADILLGE
jgi:hypothetical protein